MKKLTNLAKIVLISAITVAAIPTTSYAASDTEMSKDSVVVYFTRHAEKKTQLKESEPDSGKFTEVCGKDKCAEVLNPEGKLRAELLVKWFESEGITKSLTHAFSSHKIRTRQTIEQITKAAGLTGDVDKNANDGIQEFPTYNDDAKTVFATELAPASTKGSKKPTIKALMALKAGSVALVAGHSGTLYDIMHGIGLTDACTKKNIKAQKCNADRYPFNKKMKVKNFGEIWKVTLKDGKATFNYRKKLDMVKLESVETAN